MSQSQHRSTRTLVALIGLMIVVTVATACTHWGGHGGGHHTNNGVGYGNCQSVSPAQSHGPSTVLHSDWVSPTLVSQTASD